jgi:fatty acid desaturase
MGRGRKHFPLRYRRARSLLYVVGLFWLWLWLGGAALMEGLYHSPLHAVLAMYALAVVIPVSIAAALLAGIQMALTRPRPYSAVVVKLPAAPQQPPLQPAHWWYGEKVS